MKVAKYLRLSREDGDKEESDSISSQRAITQDYIESRLDNVESVYEFVDDGFTGTNFNRPQFQKMIEKIKLGEIDCVVVKDLSRFGRDYIDMGNYLERFFPEYDVRFIAINDGYDSDYASSSEKFVMPIKNIFNAQYSKDISKKVRSSFRAMQSSGKFVGAFASYGYKKSEKDKHILVIDEPAADIVRKIFAMYNSGIGKITIAKKLNNMNIPCPSEYKRLIGLNYTNGQRMELTKYWTYSTVNNILKNQMYIGNMVQNKTVRKTMHGKAKKNDTDNWIVVENTHEPIIDKKTWNIAQALLEKNTRQLDFHHNVGLFAGYIFCGNCGRAMSKITNTYSGKKTITYICGSYKRYGSDVCQRNPVSLDMLEKLVLDKLNEQIKLAEEVFYNPKKDKKTNIDTKKFEIELEKVLKRKKQLYEDYQDEVLTKDEYIAYKKDYESKELFLHSQIENCKNKLNEENETENKWVSMLLELKEIDHLDRETVAEVLDKITVTTEENKQKIDIVFKFKLR